MISELFMMAKIYMKKTNVLVESVVMILLLMFQKIYVLSYSSSSY